MSSTQQDENNLNPDGTRKFMGLQTMKKSRLDRHLKTLDEFTRKQGELSEEFEQLLLKMSREVRENVANVDKTLENKYAAFKDADYMTSLSEMRVFELLEEVKSGLQERSDLLENFAVDLKGIEVSRAEAVSVALEKLTNDLIDIAHLLPNAIEKIIEAESYDLNIVLTTNRGSYDELMKLLRYQHVDAEANGLQLWEDARRFWRQLRHDKALRDFEQDIQSERFKDPRDRREYLALVRQSQKERQNSRLEFLNTLAEMNTVTIETKKIEEVQKKFSDVNQREVEAIQDCYNSLGEFREHLRGSAENRVEELRKELHEYGALHDEPPLKTIAGVLQSGVNDPNLSELWRLGGGLKPEFNSLNSDLTSENVVYDYHINDIERRLEIVVSSFQLKEILDERGRLATLEKVRGLITKLKTVPKVELPDVVGSLISELEEAQGIEKLDEIFRTTIKGCAEEMRRELERIKELKVKMEADEDFASQTTGRNSRAQTSTTKSKKSGTVDTSDSIHVDPISIKGWSRKLGILYYGSDLPAELQKACHDSLSAMSQQRTCNKIVDEIVFNISSRTLRLMDIRYKKLTDRIMSFMEAQASSMGLCTTNLTEFYTVLSKHVETHRAAQKSLDEKHEDEVWECEEDFRIMLEEKESSIEEACTRVKQSNSDEEVDRNFDIVLSLLQSVEDSYRDYHAKACFFADKYPLSLVHEIKEHQSVISKALSMAPKLPHSVINEYDRLFSEMLRLNKQFLEKNMDEDIVGSGETAIRYKAKKTDVPDEGTNNDAEEDATHDADITQEDNGNNDVAQAVADEHLEEPQFPDYSSLNARSEVWDPAAVDTTPLEGTTISDDSKSSFDMNTIGNKYLVYNDIKGIVSLLYDEKPEEDPTENSNAEGKNEESEEAVTEANVAPEVEQEEIKTLEGYPWLKDTMNVLTSEELSALEADDELDGEYTAYNKRLIEAFVSLDEEALSELSEEQVEQYNAMRNTVNATKEMLEQEKDPIYICANVPKDEEGNEWVIPLSVDSRQLVEMISNLRDCLIADLEKECYDRLRTSEKESRKQKEKFTEELEDRIRTHWPRRGRVETGIKKPREAELMGHQQKTYRHIKSIHSKMIDLQDRFMTQLSNSKKCCDEYVNDVAVLRNSLTTTTWKSLAALQAVDAKARATTIRYQEDVSKQMKALDGMLNEEIEAISAYAINLLNLCPQQEPGKEGGYSESELKEIENYVKDQCDEIISVQKDWSGEVDALREQQEQSLSTIETFTSQYEKSSLELALSEGLGQKYGAPRRRAQEKLRTMVSRDEQSAGKIDELLAKLDFICSEETNRANPETPSTVADSSEKEDAVSGEVEITKATEIWDLLIKVRTAMKRRVEYLDIDQNSPEVGDISWIPDSHETSQLKCRELPVDDAYHHTLSNGKLKAFVEEVDRDCREETKQLYQSIGREDALGEAGIPESLEKWLTEKREKLLGADGYHEKAWKRLWSQIGRLEIILCRKIYESKEEEELNVGRVGAPVVALRCIGAAYSNYIVQERENMEKKFRKVLVLLERGREKNERLLRPRLGSPDAIDELNSLDNDEGERSRDLSNAVTNFQDLVARRVIELSKMFLEDIGVAYKSLMLYLDSSLRLDGIILPPDTTMPVKMLTLKRLRKAVRIKKEVEANGGTEDRSKFRTWPTLSVEGFLEVLSSAETIIDENNIPQPEPEPEPEPDPKAKKKAPPKGKPVEPEPAKEKPTMVPSSWLTSLAANTCVAANVTTGHRAIVKERDTVVASFVEEIRTGIEDIKVEYNKVLKQEQSWKERWQRQVGMLRSGVM